ncbi:MAG TPA: alpha/beta hydrolase [Ohtaekwangia sp.]|nr:alpha/beta hydrolase [Ohtaekwangia sp.]
MYNRSWIALIFALACIQCIQMKAQETIPLYQGSIPNSIDVPDEEEREERNGIVIVRKITRPTLTIFPAPAETANGTAVIIFPGGGYWINAISHEGEDVARRLNENGITAFVVKYRIPNDAAMKNRKTGPLQDAQQAIAWVRANASKWKVDPARIGIMGFSAGGHLASTAGTHFDRPVVPQKVSVRPDFMILVYPVISFRPEFGHLGSRDQLIGKEPDPKDVQYFSNELHVTKQTPPTFLVHAVDDQTVPVENTTEFFSHLRKQGVAAEMHVYQKGGHGFGMNNPLSESDWVSLCLNWLAANGLRKKS